MKMKRFYIVVLAVALAVMAVPMQAMAEHLTGSNDWTVSYTSAGKMSDNYSEKQWADDMRGLQPGDDITFTVTLKHENSQAADWYMSNDVIKSLEAGAAAGSAYGYQLTYTNAKGTARTLYDSDQVGGDDTKGLNDATSGLKDFFYLDNLSKGQTASVKLKVTLDGETEGNAYFNTLAQLKMKFAVEPPTQSSKADNKTRTVTRTIVQTGDETNLFPLFVIVGVAGAALLAMGIVSLRLRKREREEAQQ